MSNADFNFTRLYPCFLKPGRTAAVILLTMAFIFSGAAAAVAEIVITTETTWNSNLIIGEDIRIKSGGKLTVSGASLTFDSTSGIWGIYLEAGGALTLESGATLTVAGYDSARGWQGIINNGGNVAIQNATLQGANYAVFQNNEDALLESATVVQNSVIEYCNTGIRTAGGYLKVIENNFVNTSSTIYLDNVSRYNDAELSLVCGNTFTNNKGFATPNIEFSGTNHVMVRGNTFQDSKQNILVFQSNSINDAVFIAFNNFLLADGGETGYYIVANDGSSPVGVYDCYWSYNGNVCDTKQEINDNSLINSTSGVVVYNPLAEPVSGSDNSGPQLVETSPPAAKSGTVVDLTLILADSGWSGLDPAFLTVNLQNKTTSAIIGVTVVSVSYTNRQYLVVAKTQTTLTQESYYWLVSARDLAGNSIQAYNQADFVLSIQDDYNPASVTHDWGEWPAGEYRLITIPVNPYQKDQKTALGATAPDTTVVRWQNDSLGGGKYVYYGDSSLESFAPGKGFWVKKGLTEATFAATIAGDPQNGELQLSLPVGWYLLGNPFSAAIGLPSRVTFIFPDSPTERDWDQAVLNGYIANGLWGYDGSQYYLETATVEAWQGYWIRVKKACKIVFRTTDFSYLGSSANNWSMRMLVTQGGQSDGAGYFGLARGAAAGVDVFDAEKPPAITSGLKSFFIPENAAGEYGLDLRSTGSAKETWNFNVTGLTPGEARISWPGLSAVPSNYQLMLRDRADGTEVNLRGTNAYVFTVGGAAERNFEIIMTDLDSLAARITNIRMSQNPFASFRESLTVYYDLNVTAVIEIRIYDWVGNLVYVYPTGQVSAGTGRQFVWNGRNNLGKAAANGIYFCKITARNGSSQTSQVIKIAVVN